MRSGDDEPDCSENFSTRSRGPWKPMIRTLSPLGLSFGPRCDGLARGPTDQGYHGQERREQGQGQGKREKRREAPGRNVSREANHHSRCQGQERARGQSTVSCDLQLEDQKHDSGDDRTRMRDLDRQCGGAGSRRAFARKPKGPIPRFSTRCHRGRWLCLARPCEPLPHSFRAPTRRHPTPA